MQLGPRRAACGGARRELGPRGAVERAGPAGSWHRRAGECCSSSFFFFFFFFFYSLLRLHSSLFSVLLVAVLLLLLLLSLVLLLPLTGRACCSVRPQSTKR